MKNIFWGPSLVHLLISAVAAALVAGLVFLYWFPAELRYLAGGGHLFATIVGVDVICGPLLTLILYRPTKTRLALTVDFLLIAVVQLAALGYGMYALAQARPVAFVFEVDRFRAISYADIPENDLKDLPDWVSPWSLAPPRMLGVRPTTSPKERMESFDAALQGVDAGQRPARWQAYASSYPEVLAQSKPLLVLETMHPTRLDTIEAAVKRALADTQSGETLRRDELRWLPLVSRSTLEWVGLIDPNTLRIRALAPLDGFKQ